MGRCFQETRSAQDHLLDPDLHADPEFQAIQSVLEDQKHLVIQADPKDQGSR